MPAPSRCRAARVAASGLCQEPFEHVGDAGLLDVLEGALDLGIGDRDELGAKDRFLWGVRRLVATHTVPRSLAAADSGGSALRYGSIRNSVVLNE